MKTIQKLRLAERPLEYELRRTASSSGQSSITDRFFFETWTSAISEFKHRTAYEKDGCTWTLLKADSNLELVRLEL